MEPVIWVEVLSRHHREVVARHGCAAAELRIGRGYDNDVILDDPYVAAQHLRIFRDEAGRLVAEDIGSANGLFLDRGKERLQRIVMDGEQPIRIGHTFLRIRDASHAVPRERAPRRLRDLGAITLIAVLSLAALGMEATSTWFAEIGEPHLSYYLMRLLGVAALVLTWSGVWAILARIFSGRARFEHHLLVGLAGFLALSLYGAFAPFAAFAFSWEGPDAYEYIALWCLLAAVCFLHLRTIDGRRLRLKGGIVLGLLAVAIATHSLTRSEARADFGQVSYLQRLLPPALRLAPPRDEDAFFAAIEHLKDELDHDRNKTPPDERER